MTEIPIANMIPKFDRMPKTYLNLVEALSKGIWGILAGSLGKLSALSISGTAPSSPETTTKCMLLEVARNHYAELPCFLLVSSIILYELYE